MYSNTTTYPPLTTHTRPNAFWHGQSHRTPHWVVADGLSKNESSPILSDSTVSVSPKVYVIEHVDPSEPSEGMHDQRDSGVIKPSCHWLGGRIYIQRVVTGKFSAQIDCSTSKLNQTARPCTKRYWSHLRQKPVYDCSKSHLEEFHNETWLAYSMCTCIVFLEWTVCPDSKINPIWSNTMRKSIQRWVG